MTSVETASPLELSILSGVVLLFAGAAWAFIGFWGRMWTESIESRAVDRRYMRWQRSLFRGRYPLGHWRKPWSLSHLNSFVFVWRAFVVFVVVVYFLAIGRRILGGHGP